MALLKVKNDMLHELDKGKSIMLSFLDFSSAFDMIYHGILINRMQKEFGVTGSVINLRTSYLKDGNTRVCVLGEYSKDHVLQYGIPQGFFAGPPIFTKCAQPNIIRRFQIGYHIYADDTQLYVSFDPKSEEDVATAKSRLTDCIAEMRSWMLANKLKLNDSKTELFLIASPRNTTVMSYAQFRVGSW